MTVQVYLVDFPPPQLLNQHSVVVVVGGGGTAGPIIISALIRNRIFLTCIVSEDWGKGRQRMGVGHPIRDIPAMRGGYPSLSHRLITYSSPTPIFSHHWEQSLLKTLHCFPFSLMFICLLPSHKFSLDLWSRSCLWTRFVLPLGIWQLISCWAPTVVTHSNTKMIRKRNGNTPPSPHLPSLSSTKN